MRDISSISSNNSFLVTGGLGFIGINLCSHILDQVPHAEIHVVDNLQSSAISPEDARQISDRLKITVCDLADFDPSGLNISAIFHLASIVGPVGVISKRGNIARSILNDTLVVCGWARSLNASLVHVSSSEIYGGNGVLSEQEPCVYHGVASARSEYAQSKLLSEIVLQNCCKDEFLYQIVRPFNVSGPYQLPDNGFVLPRFVIQALLGLPLTVYGDGLQVRAFTDVRDICAALLTVAKSTQSDVWNVGNSANILRIAELADRVRNAAGRGTIVKVDPRRIHGPHFAEANDKIPDESKIRRIARWTPKYSLSETIDDALAYWKDKNRYRMYSDFFINEQHRISSNPSSISQD